MCPSPTLQSSTQCSDDVSVDPSPASMQEALKRMLLLRDNDFTTKAVRDMIAEVEGQKPRKQKSSTTTDVTIVYEHRVQFWSGIQCDDQLGDASAQRNLDATNISCLSDNTSLAPFCREHPSDRADRSTAGKCSDDGRGLVKNLSGRLARKLQRNASSFKTNSICAGRGSC